MLHRRPPGSTAAVTAPSSPTNARRMSYPVTQAANSNQNTLYAPLQYSPGLHGPQTSDLGNAYDDLPALNSSPAGPLAFVVSDVSHAKKGLTDALRLEVSIRLIWSDSELRNTVLKLTLINILSIISLSIFDLLLVPMLSSSQHSSLAVRRTHMAGLLFEVLFSWPVFVICFWINLSPPTQNVNDNRPIRSQIASIHNISLRLLKTRLLSSLSRIAMIGDFTIVSRVLSLIPFIGWLLSISYVAIIDSYYCFEYTFVSREWPLSTRIRYMQDRAMYMLGFGMPVTLCCTFGAPLVNIGIFAILYPIFVVQALHAKPPTPSDDVDSLLPATPSRTSSPAGMRRNSFVPKASYFRVPIFALAIHAISALSWLGEAFGRDRSGTNAVLSRERGEKRLR